MNFSKIVLGKLGRLFRASGMEIVQCLPNYVRVESDRAFVVVAHDPRDKMNSIYVGKITGESYPLNNDLLNDVFNIDANIESAPIPEFVSVVADFLESEVPLLMGEDVVFEMISKYMTMKNERYTQDVINRQYMQLAQVAWKNKDYRQFVKMIDYLNPEDLEESMRLKYEISQEKIAEKFK